MAKSSSPSCELDFFSMEKKSNGFPAAAKPPIFQRRRSFRDIQGVVSKMNPEVVKSVIENGGVGSNKLAVPVPSTPMAKETSPRLGLRCGYENTAPMTIFYNGVVLVLDVSSRQAEEILKVAEATLPNKEKNLLESVNGELVDTKERSLHRFCRGEKKGLTLMKTN